MCGILVDGVKKLACQTRVREGMNIRFTPREESALDRVEICPCNGIAYESQKKTDLTKLNYYQSPEAQMEASQIAKGKCHGLICRGIFRRTEKIADEWIDWSFPWSDWSFGG
jgi:hypothetical protein